MKGIRCLTAEHGATGNCAAPNWRTATLSGTAGQAGNIPDEPFDSKSWQLPARRCTHAKAGQIALIVDRGHSVRSKGRQIRDIRQNWHPIRCLAVRRICGNRGQNQHFAGFFGAGNPDRESVHSDRSQSGRVSSGCYPAPADAINTPIRIKFVSRHSGAQS